MTYDKLCELAKPMEYEQEIALYREYADKGCTACHGGGHSHDFNTDSIEPCWCLNLLVKE
jgi:hypothetical protein|tara:strand:- start:3895 stop:4074 length:180 start_codon:yes stop_codon:yes gene_type:complete